MMRNHKIVSTVSATSLLGFVAQRIFTTFFFLYFFDLTLPLFYFVVTSTTPETSAGLCQSCSRLLLPLTHSRTCAAGVDLFYSVLRHYLGLTDISAHPDKITFPVNR